MEPSRRNVRGESEFPFAEPMNFSTPGLSKNFHLDSHPAEE